VVASKDKAQAKKVMLEVYKTALGVEPGISEA